MAEFRERVLTSMSGASKHGKPSRYVMRTRSHCSVLDELQSDCVLGRRSGNLDDGATVTGLGFEDRSAKNTGLAVLAFNDEAIRTDDILIGDAPGEQVGILRREIPLEVVA